jgi:hypothetical protein
MTAETDRPADKPPRRKRSIPISLRIVASLALLGLGGAAWFGLLVHQRHTAIAAIERAGGSVSRQRIGPRWLRDIVGDSRMALVEEVDAVSFNRGTSTDAELLHVRALESLQGLYLNEMLDSGLVYGPKRSLVTDAGLAHIPGLNRLWGLGLVRTQVTGSGFIHLARMQDLEILNCAHSPITDDALRHLKRLKSLKGLDLRDTRITDAGAAHLAELTNLTSLDLGNNRLVSDAALRPLRQLEKLQTLLLGGTSVKEAAINEFKLARPNVTVLFWEMRATVGADSAADGTTDSSNR